MCSINIEERYDIKKVSLAAIMFDWIFCPICGEKMERTKSLDVLHWECYKCNWATLCKKEKEETEE